jgi:hypothetical protein
MHLEPRSKLFMTPSDAGSIIVAHRRSGKTTAAINKLVKEAIACQLPSPRFDLVAPNASMDRRIKFSDARHADDLGRGDRDRSDCDREAVLVPSCAIAMPRGAPSRCLEARGQADQSCQRSDTRPWSPDRFQRFWKD